MIALSAGVANYSYRGRIMDFHTYTTMRDWTRRADPDDRPAQDIDQFYRRAITVPMEGRTAGGGVRVSVLPVVVIAMSPFAIDKDQYSRHDPCRGYCHVRPKQ